MKGRDQLYNRNIDITSKASDLGAYIVGHTLQATVKPQPAFEKRADSFNEEELHEDFDFHVHVYEKKHEVVVLFRPLLFFSFRQSVSPWYCETGASKRKKVIGCRIYMARDEEYKTHLNPEQN